MNKPRNEHPALLERDVQSFNALMPKSRRKAGRCWLWYQSPESRPHYGNIHATLTSGQRVLMTAHRFSWELHRGPVPDGLLVLHNCPSGDNPACVNPDHLWLGTHQDNMRDMHAKGRSGRTAAYRERARQAGEGGVEG